MKQTAIDWLISQIEEGSATSETYEFMYIKIPYNALKEAKVMEKFQIMKAYNNGASDILENKYKNMHEYYEENYGGKNGQN